jgi:hypothetical protein
MLKQWKQAYEIYMLSVFACLYLYPLPECLKLDVYITAPEPISTEYSINPSHQSVCLPFVVRRLLDKHVTAATNICNNRIIIRRVVFLAVRFVSHESMSLSVYHPNISRQRLGKHIPEETKNWWRSHFPCYPCRTKGRNDISSSQNFFLKIRKTG